MNKSELSSKTVAELKILAQDLGITRISSKTKNALIEAILQKQPSEPENKPVSNISNPEILKPEKQKTTSDKEKKPNIVLTSVNPQTIIKAPPKQTHPSNQNQTNASKFINNKNLNPNQNPQSNQATNQQSNNFANEATVEVTGILDIMSDGTHGVLRTHKLVASNKDTYISISQVKKLKLRRGDLITGTARLPKENERYYSLLWIKTVNNTPIDQIKERPGFEDLKPVYPNKQIKLECGQHPIANRIIDILAPIGFGQRAMIVAPPKSGKTFLLKDIAKGINENYPEVHLIVVLIGERPEEVTDIERSVKGTVYASNFDESPQDQVTVAELSLERAKRIAELGQDVIVLMDSLTRLARAYNVALPASGRTLSGGLDPVSLYPSKRFFGAARNFENGASLTIVATSLVDTGSKMDDVIFEEFKGTGNMELKLDRKLSNKRVFPAIDLLESGTRNEELLLGNEALHSSWKIRRLLESLGDDANEALIDRMKSTKTNDEFLNTLHQY